MKEARALSYGVVVAGLLVGCGDRPMARQPILETDRDKAATESATAKAPDDHRSPERPFKAFFDLLDFNDERAQRQLAAISKGWQPGYAAMLLEVNRLSKNSDTGRGIKDTLRRHLNLEEQEDARDLWPTVWREPYQPPANYAEFKSQLYSRIDPRFAEYFQFANSATIRLDEIVWGGVVRDGIPPLKNPLTLTTENANYLADSDIVFGITVGDDARAYPKRILAWHEMVKDIVGGVSLNGVYCTLCGSMIAYRTESAGKHYELGTSGFLYRSNKLMYDHETKSLWSTLDGKPCVGPLVGRGIALEPYYVVTTTWGEWKRRHPRTTVLSLETSYLRDYGEGVAYRNYFATDDLMFPVPTRDSRLKNKDEVLIIRLEMEQPLAIAVEFLKNRAIHHENMGQRRIVVLTDDSGANRVYAANDRTFVEFRDETLIEQSGDVWTVSEAALLKADQQVLLERVPAHRAFWFGWFAIHPETRLVH